MISLIRSGQARFRAETFGLYYPSTPDRRHWVRADPTTLRILLKQVTRYRSWRDDILAISRGGSHEWWGRRMPSVDLEGELKRLYADDPS